jgi:hypothetical protein
MRAPRTLACPELKGRSLGGQPCAPRLRSLHARARLHPLHAAGRMHRPHQSHDLHPLSPHARAAFMHFPAIAHKEFCESGLDIITSSGSVEVLASMTGLRRPGTRPGGDLSWCGQSHDAAHGFDFRVRMTRRLYKNLRVSSCSTHTLVCS